MDSIINYGLLSIVKFFIWALAILFAIFSFVVLRQVQLMTKVLLVTISNGLKFVALGLVIYALFILIAAGIIL